MNAYLNRRLEIVPDHTHPLSDVEALELSEILKNDASKYYRSGIVTYIEAISGISRKTWSWSAVKLYYSVFYLVRSLLALEGVAYVSVGKKLGWIRTVPGAVFTKFPDKRACTGDPQATKKNLSGSHGSVLYLLEKNFPNSRLLSQEIDGLYPTEWLMRAREYHNYQVCGFADPKPTTFFEKHSLERQGLARLVAAYLADEENLYTFSPEHAIVAYPTFVLKHVAKRFEDIASITTPATYWHEESGDNHPELTNDDSEEFTRMATALIEAASAPMESLQPLFAYAFSNYARRH